MTSQPNHVDGGEALVRALRAERVDALFALPDVSYAPLLRAADEHGIRIVSGRHESAQVHMADGWYRATGRMAAAAATMGPGFANMVPAVITAALEGVPVLVLATQRTERAHHAVRRGRFQWTPQLDIMKPICKFAAAVPDARRVPEYVREAFRCALAGRPGPVYLELQTEVFRDRVNLAAVAADLDPARYRAAPAAPDPGRVRDAARMLMEARCPLIVAGAGVVHAEAGDELAALAEYTGAGVMTSASARGVISEDHPQHVVYVVSDEGTAATRDSDVVLAVGTPVGEMLAYGRPPIWAGSGTQRWIHLDADPASIGVNRDVDVPLLGDAKVGLVALLDAARALGSARQPGAAITACIAEAREKFGQALALAGNDGSPIHPARLAKEVADFVPDDAIMCFDGGNTTLWAMQINRFHRPRSLLWTSHFGHLGTGLPYAIGAKLAHPDRPVVLYSGDGAFGFNLQELETAARNNANVVCVVAADYQWGMEYAGLMMEIGKTIGVDMSHARYDQAAVALGCHGAFVDAPDQIRPALDGALAAGKPAVVHAAVDPMQNVAPPFLAEFGQMYEALHD